MTDQNIGNQLKGFGALGTNRSLIDASGVIAAHQVFPYKSNEKALFTVMQKEDHSKLAENVLSEIFKQYVPVINKVSTKWEGVLPVYNADLLKYEDSVNELTEKGVYINANWHKGISVKDCIGKSKKISAFL